MTHLRSDRVDRVGMDRVLVLYWPLILLAIVQAHALFHAHRRLTWIVAAAMLAPVGAATAYTGRLALLLREKYSEPIQGPRAGVYAEPRCACSPSSSPTSAITARKTNP